MHTTHLLLEPGAVRGLGGRGSAVQPWTQGQLVPSSRSCDLASLLQLP